MLRISASPGRLTRVGALVCPLAVGAVLVAASVSATARATLVVGVVLPAADPALAGVRLGAAEAARSAELFGATFALHEMHAKADEVRSAAVALIRSHGATVLIGGADAAAAGTLMDVAHDHGVVFINVGAPEDSLRVRCSPLTFHVTPAESMLRDATAAVDIAGAAPAAWHSTLTRYGAAQVNERFRAMFDRPISERAWAGWFAVKIVWEAALRGNDDARALADHMAAAGTVFDGHKGIPLSFRAHTHQLRQPVYLVADDTVVAETPSPRDAPELEHAVLLDRIGRSVGGETCTN